MLGISQSTAPIPSAARDRGGHPKGLEVDERRRSRKDAPPASTDMGAGGSGTQVDHGD